MKKLLLYLLLLLCTPALHTAHNSDRKEAVEHLEAHPQQKHNLGFESFDFLASPDPEGSRPFSAREKAILKEMQKKYKNEQYKDGESFNETLEDPYFYTNESIITTIACLGGIVIGSYALYNLATKIYNYWLTRHSKPAKTNIADSTSSTKQAQSTRPKKSLKCKKPKPRP